MAEPKRPEFDAKNLNQDNASWNQIGPEIRAVFLQEVDDALTSQGEETASRVLDWIYGDYKEAILVAYRRTFNEPRDNVKRVYPKVFTVTTDLRSDEFKQLRRSESKKPRTDKPRAPRTGESKAPRTGESKKPKGETHAGATSAPRRRAARSILPTFRKIAQHTDVKILDAVSDQSPDKDRYLVAAARALATLLEHDVHHVAATELLHDYIAPDNKPATQKKLRILVKEAVEGRGTPSGREKALKRIPSK